MHILEIILIGVGLSMDAFTVSISKGLSIKEGRVKAMLTAGAWFGGFQFLMPIVGYFAGRTAAKAIDQWDHWIAFVLLLLIGGNMIREALKDDPESTSASMNPGEMALLAVATSIDALAVGVTFAFTDTHIFQAACLIGVTTFLLSAAGIRLGRLVGSRFEQNAEIAGGVVLILVGLKTLLSGLGII